MTLTDPSPDTAEATATPLAVLADFLSGPAVQNAPTRVWDAAERGALDLLGCAVLGCRQPEFRPLLAYLGDTYAFGASTLLGWPDRLAPDAAAYANAAAGHLLDFDDCHDALRGHPTAVIFPAALALGEQVGASGRQIVEAYVVGVEVCSVIGRALHHTHYERGWHPTATLGIFGAAAAAARILGLSAGESLHALAIAASFSSGIKGNFGTLLKPAQVGLAAANGVQAARLAAGGVTANPDVFSSGHSFPMVFNGTNDIDWSDLAMLGRDWNMTMPGLVFKLYPCCGSTHASIDAMLTLREKHGLRADQLAKIEIYTHPRRMPHTDRAFPETSLQAKFSNQYAVAVTALKGAPSMSDFTTQATQHPEIQRLLRATTFAPLPPEDQGNLPGRLDCFAARVAVETIDGERYEAFLPTMKGGDPARPLSTDDIEQKFVANVADIAGTGRAASLLDAFREWVGGSRSTDSLTAEASAAAAS